MKVTRWAPLLALMLVLGLFVAACGDDDDDEQPAGGGQEQQTQV
jgi:hypothetical protein